MRRFFFTSALFASAIALAAPGFNAGPAAAQAYPTKPIRVLVPFAAGGAVDVLARLVTAKVSESVGQPTRRTLAGCLVTTTYSPFSSRESRARSRIV